MKIYWPMMSTPTERLNLRTGEVQVFAAALTVNADQLKRFSALLSAEEHQRAARFKFEHHRQRFIISCGYLRQCLQRYTSIDAKQLEFHYGAHGKPFLAPCHASPVHFNISHSEELVLLAFTANQELGVDVEHLSVKTNTEAIARRFFASEEVTSLLALPEGERLLGFFKGWTRKEAFIKALGEGLSFPLQDFVVNLEEGANARLLSIHGSEVLAQEWSLHELIPAENYVGALAVQGMIGKLELWRLE